MTTDGKIIVYGTHWCGDCVRAKRILDESQIAYNWINIDQVPDANQYVMRVNSGKRIIPTILFPDGSILVEPSDEQLYEKLSLER